MTYAFRKDRVVHFHSMALGQILCGRNGDKAVHFQETTDIKKVTCMDCNRIKDIIDRSITDYLEQQEIRDWRNR